MPVILLWGAASIMAGYGLKLVGDGINEAADSVTDLMIVGAVMGGAYVLAKGRGWI